METFNNHLCYVILFENHQHGGTHGMTNRLRGYTRQKRLGNTEIHNAEYLKFHHILLLLLLLLITLIIPTTTNKNNTMIFIIFFHISFPFSYSRLSSSPPPLQSFICKLFPAEAKLLSLAVELLKSGFRAFLSFSIFNWLN